MNRDDESRSPDPLDEFRRRYGFDERFDSEIREVFRREIIEQYRAAFCRYLKDHRRTLRDLADTSIVNRAQPARWEKKETQFSLETVFLYLAFEELDVHEIGFPSGLEARMGAIAATLAHIRKQIESRTKCTENWKPLDSQQLDEFIKAYNQWREATRPEHMTTPHGARPSEMPSRRMLKSVGDWLIPMALFSKALPVWTPTA